MGMITKEYLAQINPVRARAPVCAWSQGEAWYKKKRRERERKSVCERGREREKYLWLGVAGTSTKVEKGTLGKGGQTRDMLTLDFLSI